MSLNKRYSYEGPDATILVTIAYGSKNPYGDILSVPDYHVAVSNGCVVAVNFNASATPADNLNLRITLSGQPFEFNLAGYISSFSSISVTSNASTGIDASTEVPYVFSLSQNYPNPFNPLTNISFTLPSKGFVSLKVFDMLGRDVASIVSEEMSAGCYTRRWNAKNMSSGIYFYRLQVGTFIETKKLIVLK
jgi:hypothetical protein